MVVADFNIAGAGICPAEADTVLIVDTDAPLTGAISTQRFKAICRWHAQVSKRNRGIQHRQLPHGDSADALQLFDLPTGEESSRRHASERDYWHGAFRSQDSNAVR